MRRVALALLLAVGQACGGGAASDATPRPGDEPDRWRPRPGLTWQWQLSGTLDSTLDVEAYDLDLFATSTETIAALRGAGRRVICYFDTAYEPDRPESARLEPFRGAPMEGWPGQFWLDLRAREVRDVMIERVALAAGKGCDAIEPDDVDPIDNEPGLPLTAADQLDFIRLLVREGHARGLAVALKNDLGQIPALVGEMDFAINEECMAFDECDALAPFLAADKPVLHVEYTEGDLAAHGATICPAARAAGFDTLVKHLDLDAAVFACR